MRDFLVSGWGFSMGTEFQFHSWRVFVLVCALPAIAALIGLMFMPESPRFLLEVHHSVYVIPYRGANSKITVDFAKIQIMGTNLISTYS